MTYSFYDLTQEFFKQNIDTLQTKGGWVQKQENMIDTYSIAES